MESVFQPLILIADLGVKSGQDCPSLAELSRTDHHYDFKNRSRPAKSLRLGLAGGDLFSRG
jgi:hypothetical protein